MRKKRLQTITAILLLAIMVSSMPTKLLAKGATSGWSGYTDVSWRYDSATHTLYLSGKGPMDDYSYGDDAPAPEWDHLSGKVEKIVIEKGVTRLGNYAFYGMDKLKEVIIPNTVKSMGYEIFSEAWNGVMTKITLPQGLKNIPQSCFFDRRKLEKVNIPNSVTKIGQDAFIGCGHIICPQPI